jgi:rhodanese-related sulfurtransferase
MSIFSFGKKTESDLSPAEFETEITGNKDAYVLDVRTKAETAEGMLPGAKNIDFFSSAFRDEISKMPKDKKYYVYCRSGQRSGQAVKFMNDNGYTAFNLKGGMMAWSRR